MSATPGAVPEIGPTSIVRFHPLAVRPSDDDPDTYVAGRQFGREFVALPRIGTEAIRLLDDGYCVDQVEVRLEDDGDRPDIAGLVGGLADLGFVATVDGRDVPEPAGSTMRAHLGWVTERHVRWLFSWPAKVCYAALVVAALWTASRRPGVLPVYQDYFWTRSSVGLVILINTLTLLAGAIVHELMHLAAARSVGVPARIGLGTRLNNLVLQTDVSAAWMVPRRFRYRIYLAGLYWDTAAVCAALLVIAYAGPGPTVNGLLAAYVIAVIGSMVMQSLVFMRTDLYYVLLDLLKCGDLFHDGLSYLRFGLTRAAGRVRPRRYPAPPNPLRDLAPHERRAVGIYTPLLVLGSAVALTVAGLYVIPILVESVTRAVAAVVAAPSGGSVTAAVDGVLVLLVVCGLQVLFLFTFYRSRRGWFRRVAAGLRRHAEDFPSRIADPGSGDPDPVGDEVERR